MMKGRQNSIPGYLYVLDGLRAVSLILIFMFHTWQQSWIFYRLQLTKNFTLFDFTIFQQFGYLAIDAFFVLSGFCLFYPIARDMFGESQFKGWKDFFLKRVRRIYPSYIIILIVLILIPSLSQLQYNSSSFADVFKHTVFHLLFIHNFDGNILMSMAPTAWTLAIEIQFYILFPLICIPFKKKPVLTFIGMLIFSQAVRLFLISFVDINQQAQSWTISYLDIFGCGMLSAYFVVYARNKLKNIDKMKLLMTFMSVVCIAAAVCFFMWIRKISFPQGTDGVTYFRFLYRIIFAVFLAGFIFTACFSYDFWQKKIWGNRLFIFLSSISYTFYLWHQNIYIFLKTNGIPYTTSNPVMNDRAAMEGLTLICFVSSLVISVLVTKFVEEPISKYGYKGYFSKIFEFGSSIFQHKKKTSLQTQNAIDEVI